MTSFACDYGVVVSRKGGEASVCSGMTASEVHQALVWAGQSMLPSMPYPASFACFSEVSDEGG